MVGSHASGAGGDEVWRLDCVGASELPRLAWCAVVRHGHVHVQVYHGPWVAATDQGFVEGAWSGAYSQLAFPEARTFTGSGGIVTPVGLLLASPTNSVEPLYVLRSGSELHCSNSLPLVLASAGDDLDGEYFYYDLDLTSMAYGLARCCKQIPTRNKNRLRLYYYCNCLISHDLSVKIIQKQPLGPFRDYSHYRSVVAEQVRLTIQNSADPLRAIRYAPLATVSTGYDSAAAAVLAREAGCREAITFTTARDATGHDTPDSGAEIGQRLGLNVTEYTPCAYRARVDLPEAEFVATGGGGGSVVFTAAEPSLAGRILVSGNYGGEAWERVDNKGGPGMLTFDSAGADLAHYRTRVGFLHFPVGAIGYSAYASIRAITHSVEMRPWSLDREQYDRPIPRRIIEEAGVPREMFGQQKKAVARSLKYCNPYTMADPDLDCVMAPASFEHFQSWAEDRKLYRGPLDRLTFSTMQAMYRLNLRMIRNPTVRSAARQVRLDVPTAPCLPLRFRKRRTPHRLLFHWGMEQIRARYGHRAILLP